MIFSKLFPVVPHRPAMVGLLIATAWFATGRMAYAQSIYYWDTNGSSSGFGAASGTWAAPTIGSSSQGWTTDINGGVVPGDVTTTTSDSLNFGRPNFGLSSGTITVSGSVDSGNMTFASTSGAITLTGGTINFASARTITLDYTSTENLKTIDSVIAGAGNLSILHAGDVPGNYRTTLGAITNNGNLTLGGTGTASNNPQTIFRLTKASTYTGNTIISVGNNRASVQLELGVDDGLATTSVLEFGSRAGSGSGRQFNLDLRGFDQTLGGVSGTSSALRVVRVNNSSSTAATLTINDSGDRTFTGILGSSSLGTGFNPNGNRNFGVVKNGAGTWTLNAQITGAATNNAAAPNSYLRGTILNQGGITLGTGATLGDSTGPLQVNNTNSTGAGTNVTLTLSTGSDLTVGSLSGTLATPTSGVNTATIQTGGSGRTLTINQTTSGTYEGTIGGGGNVTLGSLSTETLRFAGSNTFTGTLTIAAGTLEAGTLNDASTNGPLGNRAGAVLLGSSGATGTLSYTGATAATTKPFTAVTGGTAAFSVTEAATVLTLSGAIDGDGDKSFGGAGSTIVSGAISGGNVVKTGGGTLTLENLNGQANTTVNAGQLNINQFAALGISTGTLTMAAGTSLDNTSGSAITITNPKSIALGNSLTFVGTNDLDLGEGTTTLADTTTFTVSAGTLTLSGDVVGAGFGIVKEGAGTLRLDGLSGTGSFTGNSTINAGTLLLEGSSTLGGTAATTVTLGASGFLEVGASASLGNVTVAGVTGNLITNSAVNANQEFTVSQTLSTTNSRYNGVQTLGAGVTVTTAANYLGTIPASATAGRIVFENGSTLAATAGFSIDPTQGISLDAGTATVSVVAGQAVFFESAVAGSGGLRKTGAGNLRLTGSNSYEGGTVIEQGILGISSGAALGDISGSLTIDGTILAAATNPDGSGTGATIDAARVVLIGNGKTSGLHAQNALTLRYDGAIGEIDSQGTAGTLQFGLAGPRAGTVILGGANTYRGDTILSAGTLKLGSGGSFDSSPTIVVGDATGSSAAVLDLTEKTSFAIAAGQTLRGKGIVRLGSGTDLTIAGLLSPGNSPELLTFDGGGTVDLDGTTLIEVEGTVRGSGYDAIDVLGGTTLTLGSILELAFSQTFADGTNFDLFTPDGTSSLTGTFSQIDMTGSAYGDLTFTQAGTSGIWSTNVGAANQSMTFDSGTGTLSIVVVPEPASLALAACGLGLIGFHIRRRGRSQGR